MSRTCLFCFSPSCHNEVQRYHGCNGKLHANITAVHARQRRKGCGRKNLFYLLEITRSNKVE